MRRTWFLVIAAALAAGTSGCLSSIIPDHNAPRGADAGAQSPGGGTTNDTPTPTGTGGNDVDGGTADGAVPQSANDPNCINTATPILDGHHNAGQACLQCHDGNTATKFTAAGTVYDKLALANGATGLAGVTVEIIDAAGTKLQVVTASASAPGNFYTTTALVFPLKVRATQCPSNRLMSASLAANANPALGDGNCNRAGCHDPNMIMHVP
jgi:hypothetical protein